jgi:MFS family permease
VTQSHSLAPHTAATTRLVGTGEGVVLAATMGNIVGFTAVLSSTFGIFLVPIASEFGWGRATVSGVLSLISVICALTYPLIGRAMDRWGGRSIQICGNVAFGLAMAGLGLANGGVLQFYLLFALVGLAGAVHSTPMMCKMVAGWFDEKRGLALGISAGMGNGLGATLMPILAGLMLGPWGWRGAFVGLGVVVIVAGTPVLAWLLYDAPGSAVDTPNAADAPVVEGYTLREALRMGAFWLLLLGAAAGAGGMTAVFTHVVPILRERHVSLGQSTQVLAVFALVTAVWQAASGLLLDRLRTPRIIIPMYAIAIAGLILLQMAHSQWQLLLAGALMGIGLGGEYAALPYFISRYFGLRHYGAITGMMYSVVMLIQGVAPTIMDASFDRLGTYDLSMVVTVGALAMGMALFSLLPPPDAWRERRATSAQG